MKNKKQTLILSGIILILILVFFLIYQFFIQKNFNSFKKSIDPYFNIINSINNSMNTYTSNDGIDVKKIQKNFNTEIIKTLIKTKLSIQKITIPEKFKHKQQYLYNGIESNILLYKQAYIIATSPHNKNIDQSLKSLLKYRNNTKDNYQIIKDDTFTINFPSNLDNFINAVNKFGNDSIQKQKLYEIKSKQKSEFVMQINDIKNSFKDRLYSNNYLENANRIILENGDFTELLSSIDKDKIMISDFKVSLSKVSIPENASIIHSNLYSLLKNYDQYLQNLNYAIDTDKLTMKPKFKRDKDVQKLFKELTKNLDEIKSSFAKFEEELQNYSK